MYKHAGWAVIIPNADGVTDRVETLFFSRQKAEEAVTTLHNQGILAAKRRQLFFHEPLTYQDSEVLPELSEIIPDSTEN